MVEPARGRPNQTRPGLRVVVVALTKTKEVNTARLSCNSRSRRANWSGAQVCICRFVLAATQPKPTQAPKKQRRCYRRVTLSLRNTNFSKGHSCRDIHLVHPRLQCYFTTCQLPHIDPSKLTTHCLPVVGSVPAVCSSSSLRWGPLLGLLFETRPALGPSAPNLPSSYNHNHITPCLSCSGEIGHAPLRWTCPSKPGIL
jgi:hypothetical protein